LGTVKTKELGVKPQPQDFMFWTNLYMTVAAAMVALVLGEFNTGLQFCLKNPVIFSKLLKFALCSAVGQAFIFYTISEFDPLVCSTVTTTRKVFSVLLSIFVHGHQMSAQGSSYVQVSSILEIYTFFCRMGWYSSGLRRYCLRTL
jgi:UDP-galactose transporter B1